MGSLKSFEELSGETTLSAQTLRRFFGKIDAGKQLSVSSLSLLARYVGYRDWQDFAETISNKEKPSRADKTFIENMAVFFNNGERHNLDYHQSTLTVDTLNDCAKVIYAEKENLQYFYKLYGNNNWVSNYILAWLPKYNYFGNDRFREILADRIRKTASTKTRLALSNFLYLGSFLSQQNDDFTPTTTEVEQCYADYLRTGLYMPYHEMRYATVMLIDAKKNDDKHRFNAILSNYLSDLKIRELPTYHEQEMIVFLANTLLWLEEYALCYDLLKPIESFARSFPPPLIRENPIHFFGINTAFVKTTFLLTWTTNNIKEVDKFKLSSEDLRQISGLLYNDYIRVMHLAAEMLLEKSSVERDKLFELLAAKVEETGYSRICRMLKNIGQNVDVNCH